MSLSLSRCRPLPQVVVRAVMLGAASLSGVLAACNRGAPTQEPVEDAHVSAAESTDSASDGGPSASEVSDFASNSGTESTSAGFSDDSSTAATTPQPTDSTARGDAGPADAGVRDAGFTVTPRDAGPDAGFGELTLTISGQLLVSLQTFLDDDVKNPLASRGNNGEFPEPSFRDKAQAVPSPCQLIGYLGPAIPERENGLTVGYRADNVDYYRVELAAGDVVTLAFAGRGAGVADLDLYLLDEESAGMQIGGSWVDDSLGLGRLEQVTAPRTGLYWLAVDRYRDADDPSYDSLEAVYTLSVAVPQSSLLQETLLASKLSTRWEMVADSAFAPQGTGFRKVSLPQKAAVVDPRRTIWGLKSASRVLGGAALTPNYLYRPALAPSDPRYAEQWHYADIELETAWDLTDHIAGARRGTGVVVAVVDTGLALTHPDFRNADESLQFTVDGIDMVSSYGQDGQPDLAADGNGIDSDPTDPGDGNVSTSTFHGTHTAGTIAAAIDNNEGGSGVAPLAKVMPVRALGRGGGTVEDVAEAIRYAAGVANASGQLPARRADIISMSFSGPPSPLFQSAVNEARAQGALLIAAAGNHTSLVSNVGPAALPGVVAVAATDKRGVRARYSNTGPELDVTAPGGDLLQDHDEDGQQDGILSSVFKNEGTLLYTLYEGTSMATAHVSGVAALMKSVWVDMSPDDFDRVLASGEITRDLGNPGHDDWYGHGMIDASRAVLVAAREASVEILYEPELAISATLLDFGATASSLSLTLENVGDPVSTLTISNVNSDQPWLSMTPGALGENVVSVDRDSEFLLEGLNTASLEIESDGGVALVEVRVYVLPAAVLADVGPIRVMLLAAADAGVDQETWAMRAADGYRYEFGAVAGGRYQLFAGTDLADTRLLGAELEPYGAWSALVGEPSAPSTLCVLQAASGSTCSRNLERDALDVDLVLKIVTDESATEFDAGSTVTP